MSLTVRKGPSRDACKDTLHASPWDFGNDVLYNLCRSYPDHRVPDQVIAKVWLIGRSYAAPVERGRRNDGTSSELFYSDTLAPALLRSPLDSHLKLIDAAARCETLTDAAVALSAHDSLMHTFRMASGRSNRSLASKYLHFHRPLFFPMLDSRAAKRIGDFVSGRVPTDFPDGDDEYRRFLARFMTLRDWIRGEHGIRLTPRQIDRLLLGY